MKSLMQQALELWNEQVANWPLAAQFYGSLPQVLTREFVYDHTRVLVQFNPARVHSTTAKTDAGSIAKRPCFLCSANRPAEQREVDAGDFLILVNPFPIFQQHFTIPHKQHLPQQLLPKTLNQTPTPNTSKCQPTNCCRFRRASTRRLPLRYHCRA